MRIGLTGGIASGKSLVTEILREFWMPVIDTDVIARQVVAAGQPAWHRIKERFGAEYFDRDGNLDRCKLAAHVFSDAQARLDLEAITHPAIFAEVDRQVHKLESSPYPPPLIIIAVPLLFEVGAESRFDRIVVVFATPEQQRERLAADRGYSPAEIEARMSAQWPISEKVARATDIIDNTGTREETRENVRSWLARELGM